MARTTIKTYSITDDAAGVTVAQDDAVEAQKVSESQAVRIVMTQGRKQFTLDTSQASALAAFMRSAGRETKVRGRKPSA